MTNGCDQRANVKVAFHSNQSSEDESALVYWFAATVVEDPEAKQLTGRNWETMKIDIHRHILTLEEFDRSTYAGFNVFHDVEDVDI